MLSYSWGPWRWVSCWAGPIGDRIGPLAVIWVSILGVLPFTLALPYVGLAGSAVLTFVSAL
jgi:FSR family fosmidomycin resistance protein-like MFS transporter